MHRYIFPIAREIKTQLIFEAKPPCDLIKRFIQLKYSLHFHIACSKKVKINQIDYTLNMHIAKSTFNFCQNLSNEIVGCFIFFFLNFRYCYLFKHAQIRMFIKGQSLHTINSPCASQANDTFYLSTIKLHYTLRLIGPIQIIRSVGINSRIYSAALLGIYLFYLIRLWRVLAIDNKGLYWQCLDGGDVSM